MTSQYETSLSTHFNIVRLDKPIRRCVRWQRRFSKSRGLLACVAWRFWLGALSNKGGRGQRNREEIGARSRALRTRISRLRRSCALFDKTAMLRRLGVCLQAFPSFPSPFPLFHFLALFLFRAVKTENPLSSVFLLRN